MAELTGRELLSEWRQVMESVISSAAAAAGRSELPRELLRASQRQLELLQEIVDSERRLQGNVAEALLGPAQAVFDLLQESSAMLARQAETMDTAGRALQDTAALIRQQAEMMEKIVSILRQPTDIALAAAKGGRKKKGV
ncbi:MAG TPA: hypothetical protein VHT27_06975 [Solirubrobacteraceae bacterium]|nr:hypothetical protein [Solirubrobacteraceae bacterium]